MHEKFGFDRQADTASVVLPEPVDHSLPMAGESTKVLLLDYRYIVNK